MMIPVCVVQLNETHPAFDQATRQQTVSAKLVSFGFLIHTFQGCLVFTGGVHQFRRAGLHSIGHLVRINTRTDFLIAGFNQAL